MPFIFKNPGSHLLLRTFAGLLGNARSNTVSFAGDVALGSGSTTLMELAVPPEALQATGTDNATADTPQSAQHQAQQSGRETQRSHATRGDDRTKPSAQQESPKPLQIADLGDVLLPDAMGCESRRGGIRTPDQGISSHCVARSKPKR